MSDFKTLDQMDLAGKRVLLRVDFNVPMKDGRVSDPSRIRYVVPTIQELLDKGAAIIIASHLGRPKGEVKTEMSLRPLVSALADEIGRDVDFADDCVGRSATAASNTIQPGEVVLLENLRFEPGEEANDPGFVKKLAALAMKFGSLPFARDPRKPTKTEREAVHSAIARYQQIFNTH